ncbi:hypothetical protein XELAEV_18042534mg [Xenopus laevis]|uniref:Uncharacterized protein n=1 Tax=Xenopus laevis TaxID=8355 RepID=A0A974C4V6_XENLA|nr:hypothetical protein XELAEV_18042534mg [Xenopus laevis]
MDRVRLSASIATRALRRSVGNHRKHHHGNTRFWLTLLLDTLYSERLPVLSCLAPGNMRVWSIDFLATHFPLPHSVPCLSSKHDRSLPGTLPVSTGRRDRHPGHPWSREYPLL